MQRLQKKPFVLGFHACFQYVRIIRVYVVDSGFGILFYRKAHIPISSRLVLSPPRLPTSFTLSNICKRARSATHFVYNSFQLFFCQPALKFFENMTKCLQWFESCPNVFAVLNHLMRSDTPLMAKGVYDPCKTAQLTSQCIGQKQNKEQRSYLHLGQKGKTIGCDIVRFTPNIS